MLTDADITWLNHLSDDNQVQIVPYNPKSKEIFQIQKAELQNILGQGFDVLHRGATSMGISGKGDIDIYIPVSAEQFNETLDVLKEHLGEPGSHYPLERVRWNRLVDNFDVEVFLINEQAEGWLKSEKFENYLKTHAEALEAYRKLKEESAGLSTRAYYRRKIEFMNDILTQTD